MDEKTTKTVGIDIGGTSIKMGLVTERGEVLATSKVSTGALDSDGAFAKVCEGVHALAEQGGIDAGELDAIGLDVPGVVLEDGTLTMAPNITLDLAGLTTTLREAYALVTTREERSWTRRQPRQWASTSAARA